MQSALASPIAVVWSPRAMKRPEVYSSGLIPSTTDQGLTAQRTMCHLVSGAGVGSGIFRPHGGSIAQWIVPLPDEEALAEVIV